MIRTALACASLIAGIGLVAAPAAVAAYPNCKAAHADGRYNIPKGDPDYVSKQDRDGDGIACEG